MPITVQVAGSIRPRTTDTPTDARQRVATLADIPLIDLPYVGMLIYCVATDKYYKVTALNEDEDAVASYEELSTGGGVSAPEVVSVSGAAATIASLQGNKIYRCTEAVTSLTITAFDNATADMEAVIELTTAAAFTGVTFPTGSKFAPLEPVLQPSTSYVLSCQGKIWCASMVSQSANA